MFERVSALPVEGGEYVIGGVGVPGLGLVDSQFLAQLGPEVDLAAPAGLGL
jgi:hypothetical protein